MPKFRNLTIVKFGGSAITHKDSSPPQIKKDVLKRIIKELKNYSGQLVIVLGGGAHGHQAAHAYGFGDPSTDQKKLLDGIPSIRHNMSILANAIEEIMSQENLPAVILSPFSFVTLEKRNIVSFPTEIIEKTLHSSCIVITHGDVCFDNTFGASILSGDTITVHLAKKLDANRIFIGTNVDGVYDSNPQLNPNAKHIPIINNSNLNEILKGAGLSSATDVTGGMDHKLRELLTLANDTTSIAIFNLLIPGRLERLLNGESVLCTEIKL